MFLWGQVRTGTPFARPVGHDRGVVIDTRDLIRHLQTSHSGLYGASGPDSQPQMIPARRGPVYDLPLFFLRTDGFAAIRHGESKSRNVERVPHPNTGQLFREGTIRDGTQVTVAERGNHVGYLAISAGRRAALLRCCSQFAHRAEGHGGRDRGDETQHDIRYVEVRRWIGQVACPFAETSCTTRATLKTKGLGQGRGLGMPDIQTRQS